MAKILNLMPRKIINFHNKLAVAVVALSNKRITLNGSLSCPSTNICGKTKISDRTMMNILNGGQHVGNNLDFKKFMVIPVEGVPFTEALQMCTKVYCSVENILNKYGRNTVSGINGGFLPNLASNEEALAIIVNAIQKAGYEPGKQVFIVIDAAASTLFNNGEYNFPGEGSVRISTEMVEYYTMLINTYPIIYIKDILAKEDRLGWTLFNQQMKNIIKMVNIENFTIDIEFILRDNL